MQSMYTRMMSKPIRVCLRLLVRLYQCLIAPFIPARCRFYPSCSEYALEALTYHSVSKSLWLICSRLLRCQPFAKGGFDPLPKPSGLTKNTSTLREFISPDLK